MRTRGQDNRVGGEPSGGLHDGLGGTPVGHDHFRQHIVSDQGGQLLQLEIRGAAHFRQQPRSVYPAFFAGDIELHHVKKHELRV